MFKGDQPITCKKEDAFGRAEYAGRIAKKICESKPDNGLVLAIYGQWGSGKTSFKNLVKEALNNEVVAVEFSPWRWSGEDVIFEKFFDEIGKAIGKKEPNLKRLAEKWIIYGTYLKLGSSITRSIGLSSIVLGAWGCLIGALAHVVSIFMSEAAKTIEASKEGLQARANISKKGIDEIAEGLSVELKGTSKPIVIFIDDIDRLTVKEIRLLFTLIKANAVFPNIIFVLLFQRGLVEQALNEDAPKSDGAQYLEKIIQVGIDLPLLQQQSLEKILFAELDKIIISDPEINASWEEKYSHHWGNLYGGGLRNLFINVRQVYRFTNSFNFYYLGFRKDKEHLEVNPVDLIALETIRVFESALYEKIRNNKEMLTGAALFVLDDKAKAYTSYLENLLKDVDKENIDSYREILKLTFPVFTSNDNGDEVGNYKLKRVSQPAFFDRYFQFSLNATDLTQLEREAFLSMNPPSPENFGNALKNYIEKDKIGQLLEALEAYKAEISKDSYIGLISGLISVGDVFYPAETTFAFNTPMARAYRLIKDLLKSLPKKERKALFIQAIQESRNGVFVATRYVHAEQSESDRKNYPNDFALELNELPEIKELLCERIVEMARDNSLIKSPALFYLLFAWHEWGKDKPVDNEFIEKVLNSFKGLSLLLQNFKTKSLHTSGGDHVPKQIEGMNVQAMDNLGILEKVEASITAFSKNKNIEFQNLVELFKRAKSEFDTKNSNKPSDSVLQIS